MAPFRNSVEPITTVLGKDPDTVHRLNANAFQQSAITTFKGFQYAALYTASAQQPGVRHVSLARRRLAARNTEWDYLTFTDYEQTTDDGHNTISIGICTGDGTMHVAFDHHCDDLHFRISVPGLALRPESHEWSTSLFSEVRNRLPGASQDLFRSITYPRFVQARESLIFEARVGKAGAGSDILLVYSPSSGSYTSRGTYLIGVNNNPYINGLSYADGKLHASWTYRDFLAYEGAEDGDNSAHKTQAGPNGPENNFDLNYAFSTDRGWSWCSSQGYMIARYPEREGDHLPPGIMPHTKRDVPWQDENMIQVRKIPKDSGIMNQEAQCVSPQTGDFHVLNRDNTSGREQWRHYFRTGTGTWEGAWSDEAIPAIFPTKTGSRGDIASDAAGKTLFFLLPGNEDSSLTLIRRRKVEGGDGFGLVGYELFEVLWRGYGYDGEPSIDRERLMGGDGIVSVFTRTAGVEREVVVLDFVV